MHRREEEIAKQEPVEAVRLQKYLSIRGIASRRGAVDVIAAGRVQINGRAVTEPGVRVNEHDIVSLDGYPLGQDVSRRITIVLHKPPGYICSTNRIQGRTVYSLIRDIHERLTPVGRLDKDSEGLLLMSNDGALAQRLTHPRYEHPKLYEVLVRGAVSATALATLQSPVEIDGRFTQPADVVVRERYRESTSLTFTLREGRNRQLRRLCDVAGLRIERLRRMAIGPVRLGNLPLGAWRHLTRAEQLAIDQACRLLKV